MPGEPLITARESELEEDPLLGFNFFLELEGAAAGYFTECSGISSENEVIEHKVVDNQGHEAVRKIPGRLKWQDVSLKRGITSSLEIWQWRESIVTGDVKSARKRLTLDIGFVDWRYSNGPGFTWCECDLVIYLIAPVSQFFGGAMNHWMIITGVGPYIAIGNGCALGIDRWLIQTDHQYGPPLRLGRWPVGRCWTERWR